MTNLIMVVDTIANRRVSWAAFIVSNSNLILQSLIIIIVKVRSNYSNKIISVNRAVL